MAVTIRTRRLVTTVVTSEPVAFIEDEGAGIVASSSYVILGTITDLSATAGALSASLSWTAAANATSQQPQYSSDGETWSNFGSALSGSATQVTVTGLSAGVAYSFRVVASDGVSTTTSNVDTATPTGAGDGSVTLSGSGFGTKATVAPLLFRDFEEFAVGTSALAAGFDASNGGYAGASVQSGRSHSGTRALHCQYVADEFPTVSKVVPGGLTIYTAAWVWWERSGGPATSQHIFKLFRGGTGAVYAGNPKYYSTLRPDAVTGAIESHGDSGINDGNTWVQAHAAAEFPQQNQWNFLEVKYVLSTPGVADGRIKTYCNGVLNGNLDPYTTRLSGTTAEIAWACPWINGIDQRGDGLTYELYEDEVLIDTTFARVIATDAATYALSMKWAPQAPTAWSDTEITIAEPNWSDLTPGSTAYFHVWDAADNYIAAFPRTVP